MKIWRESAPMSADNAGVSAVSEYFEAATSIYDNFYDCLAEIGLSDNDIDKVLRGQSDTVNNDEFSALFEDAIAEYTNDYDLSEATSKFCKENGISISSEFNEFAAMAANKNAKSKVEETKSEDESEDDRILRNLKYFAKQQLSLKKSDLDNENFEIMKKEMLAFAASQGLNCATPGKAKAAIKKMLDAQSPKEKKGKAKTAIKQPQKPDWSDSIHAVFDLARVSESGEWNSIHANCLKEIGKKEKYDFVFDDEAARNESLQDFLSADDSLTMQAFRAVNNPTKDHSKLCESIGIENDIQVLNGWLPAAGDSYLSFSKDHGSKPVQGRGKKSKGSQKPENLTYPMTLTTSEFIEETMRTQQKLVDLRGTAKTQSDDLKATKSEIKKQEGILEELAVKQFKEIEMPLFNEE